MGDVYKTYYDIVRLSHQQEKKLHQHRDYSQLVISSSEASSILQRSKSNEENLHDIFVIDTVAAVPEELLENSTTQHSAGKQTNRERILSLIRSTRFGKRRRNKSYSEALTPRSSSSSDLFGLRSKAERRPKVSAMTQYCGQDHSASNSTNGVAGESHMTVYGHREEPLTKTKTGERDWVFEEAKEISVDSFGEQIIRKSPDNTAKLINKTRIISCQSDDSSGFKESRKFLSQGDLTQDSDIEISKYQRSTSLEDLRKLLDTGDSGFKKATAGVENGIAEKLVSGSCSAYRSKDSIISKLEQELKESFKLLSEKDAEVKAICADKEGDGWDKYAETEKENSKLRRDMIELKAECSRLHSLYHETVTLLEKTKSDVSRFKMESEEREKYHEKTYLKMYEKGQKAALIEREQQLEELASHNPKSVSTQELLDKLNHTQSELGRWQTLARQESYESANMPQTESEATLQFMKDCMFHYLTDKDDCGVHLRAMVRMLGFTDKEKRKMIQLRKKVKKQSAEYFSGVLLNP